MAWRHRILPRRRWWWPSEVAYEVPFQLYSQDGKRAVEVRLRRDGWFYFVDQEWVRDTTFKNRGDGEELGPFPTAEAAEAAAVSRHWFSYGEDSSSDPI